MKSKFECTQAFEKEYAGTMVCGCGSVLDAIDIASKEVGRLVSSNNCPVWHVGVTTLVAIMLHNYTYAKVKAEGAPDEAAKKFAEALHEQTHNKVNEMFKAHEEYFKHLMVDRVIVPSGIEAHVK